MVVIGSRSTMGRKGKRIPGGRPRGGAIGDRQRYDEEYRLWYEAPLIEPQPSRYKGKLTLDDLKDHPLIGEGTAGELVIKIYRVADAGYEAYAVHVRQDGNDTITICIVAGDVVDYLIEQAGGRLGSAARDAIRSAKNDGGFSDYLWELSWSQSRLWDYLKEDE